MTITTPEARPVIVGVDGSDVANDATHWAATFAERLKAPLRLVYSTPPIPPYLGDFMTSSAADIVAEMRTRGTAQLEVATGVATRAAPDLSVDTVLTDVHFSEFCVEASAHAQLLVLGSRRSGPIRDLVLGGESIRILNHATCPVLLWRNLLPDAPTSTRPVVVGIDDSPSAMHALLAAFDYASVLGAPLVVGHFWQIGGVGGIGYGTGLFDWEKVQKRQAAWLHSQVDPLCDKYPHLDVQQICYEAAPALAMQSFSTSAQMVVVGTRGHGKVVGTALGSVSQNLAHHSDCSVLVVH